jgi:ribosome-binding factor A
MAMNQTRVNQLADRIRVIVAEMLERRVKDPRLGFVTVTEARLTGDLRDATVFYTVFGGDQDRAGTAAALSSATGLIRSEVGRQLGLRHTPSLAFVPDAVPENAAHIDDLLRQARESDAEVARRAARATYAGESDPYRSAPDESDEETQ